MAAVQKEWRCLEQRGFERLRVTLPNTGQRALVTLAAEVARILAPGFGFTPDPGASYHQSWSDSPIDDYGEYTRTSERFHGSESAGVSFRESEPCSTDAAGPSSSGSTRTATVHGLPAGNALEIEVRATNAPFNNAGIRVTATLEAADESTIARAVERLETIFVTGQVAQ